MALSETVAQAVGIAKRTLKHSIGTPVMRESLSSSRKFVDIINDAAGIERDSATMFRLASRGYNFPAGMQMRENVGRLETGMENYYRSAGTPKPGKTRLFRGFKPQDPYFTANPHMQVKGSRDLHANAEWFTEDPHTASAYAGNTAGYFGTRLSMHPEAPEHIRRHGLPEDEREGG